MGTKNNKVARYRRPRQPKIGLIIFLIIFSYIIINVVIYVNKDHLSIYEVVEGKNVDDNTCKGIILRKETIVNTDKAGYVNYYLRDGERIAKKSTVYTLDESGKLYEQLLNSETEEELSADDIASIRNDISNFKKSYNRSDFNKVYDFKYDIENSILEITNLSLMNNLKDIMDKDESNSFEVVKAVKSGIITYIVDSMEDLKAEDITEETFDNTDYTKTQLRTSNLLEAGSPVYKVVTSEDWSIIIQLTEEQYNKISDKDQVSITFPKDDLTTNVTITAYKKGDGYFAKLDLDKYMIRYINDRYIDVELNINSATGLKIPKSSILEKEFYKIPNEYFTAGGDSGSKGVIKETYSKKDGEVEYQFVSTDIYYQDDEYGYVDTSVLEEGDWLHITDSDDRYQVSEVGTLEGVYNVNKGYAVFRRIEKIYENEEYCIIKTDTPYGLSTYDHIALKASTAEEAQIIY